MAQVGGTIAMAAAKIPPTVPNPKFMVRDDGMVLTWNQDVWDADQRQHKRLKCVAAMPKRYTEALNAQRTKELQQEAARRKYHDDFVAAQKKQLLTDSDIARQNRETLLAISDENLIADELISDHVRGAPQHQNFQLVTASRADIIAYMRDEMHIPAPLDLSEDQMRVDLADMLGIPVPAAARLQAYPPPPPVAATAQPAVAEMQATPPAPPERKRPVASWE